MDEFNGVVEVLKDKAVRDLQLEGYSENQIRFRLELDMRYGMQYNLMKMISPRLTLKGSEDFKVICDAFTKQYADVYSPEATFPMGGMNLECFHLTAMVTLPPLQLESMEENGPTPPDALLCLATGLLGGPFRFQGDAGVCLRGTAGGKCDRWPGPGGGGRYHLRDRTGLEICPGSISKCGS